MSNTHYFLYYIYQYLAGVKLRERNLRTYQNYSTQPYQKYCNCETTVHLT